MFNMFKIDSLAIVGCTTRGYGGGGASGARPPNDRGPMIF